MYIADYYNNRIRLITGGFIGCTPLPLNVRSFERKKKDRQIENLSINIYPGDGSVWLTSSAMIVELRIANGAGQIIYKVKTEEKKLNLPLAKAGIYFIQIFTANQQITKKLILYR
jgi:hypothetical protein